MICPACSKSNPPGARFCAQCGTRLLEATAPDGPLVGQVLGGRYRITRVIAEGGMGIVYEAEQRMGEHSRAVAVKTLLPALSRDRKLVARFYRECSVVAQLEHPNTIRFYDFGETDDGVLYVVMEFVRGRSLSEAIAEGPLPLARACRILRQLGSALEEAHALGIVHRDLKPDNVILSTRAGEPDFVKLIDFGIAARVASEAPNAGTRLTEQGSVLGTPSYMSPEQLGGGPLGAQSDIYSLGVIAYEMLSGDLPFSANTAWEWARKHLLEAPRPLETSEAGRHLPEGVKQAVLRALAKDPARRPASALELVSGICAETVQAQPFPAHTQRGTEAGGPPVGAATSPGEPPAEAVAAPVAPAFIAFPSAHRTGPAVARPVRTPSGSRPIWPWLLGIPLVGAAVSAAIVVLALVVRPPPEPPPMATAPEAPETQVAPIESEGGVETPPPSTGPVATSPAPQAPTSPPSPKPPKPAPTSTTPKNPPAPTATPTPTVTPQPVPTPPPAPVPVPAPKPTPAPAPQVGGDTACASARSQADAGQIEAAVTSYNQCVASGGSDTARQSALRRIRQRAPGEVRRRANLQDCTGARSAANAASSIGAGDLAQAELVRTRCG